MSSWRPRAPTCTCQASFCQLVVPTSQHACNPAHVFVKSVGRPQCFVDLSAISTQLRRSLAGSQRQSVVPKGKVVLPLTWYPLAVPVFDHGPRLAEQKFPHELHAESMHQSADSNAHGLIRSTGMGSAGRGGSGTSDCDGGVGGRLQPACLAAQLWRPAVARRRDGPASRLERLGPHRPQVRLPTSSCGCGVMGSI